MAKVGWPPGHPPTGFWTPDHMEWSFDHFTFHVFDPVCKQTQKGKDPTIQESIQYIQGSQCVGTRIGDVKDLRGTTCNKLEQNTWPPDHPAAAFFMCTN